MLSDLTLSIAMLAEFNAQTALKLLILAVLSPFWWPIARAMRNEILEALAPEGGLMGKNEPRPSKRPPAGLDPFLNVPLASHRRNASQSRAQTARGQARPSAAPSQRRSGF